MKAGAAVLVVLALPLPAGAQTAFHRAEQDREITYWLLAPESGQFRISHDFTVSRPGQRSVHSFVRKGSTVTQAVVVDLDTGRTLKTYNVSGKQVNALGYYPEPTPDDSVVVQADLSHPLAEGESARVRVVVSLDAEGRVACRFVNPRNDEIHVVLKARRRP